MAAHACLAVLRARELDAGSAETAVGAAGGREAEASSLGWGDRRFGLCGDRIARIARIARTLRGVYSVT